MGCQEVCPGRSLSLQIPHPPGPAPAWGMVVAKVPELIKCLWGTATLSLTSGAAQTGKSRHPADDQ